MTIYNPVLTAGASAWFAAQLIKVILNMIKYRKFNSERIFGSGGMPSSHSATVCAASAVTLRICGPASAVFGVMCIVSVIVMYDAMNVRYHSGLHAREINMMRKEFKSLGLLDDKSDNKTSGKELKELLGHTLPEVICGAILGIAFGVFVPVL
ncbi:divergent PAP2 family protein [Porcipelethomonas sp.]|uniref:divergent PAP2 family protein n=1 Tax=Porcipelethomonas sp. TaxID=2981675 RepID=UPI003EF2B3F5